MVGSCVKTQTRKKISKMTLLLNSFVCFLVCLVCIFQEATTESTRLSTDFELVTVASDENDGYQRFARSAEIYDIPVTTLGLGQPWLGGDMLSIGGGYKVKLLKKHVEQFKDDKDKVIMFTDSFDVIILSGVEKILSTFEFFDCRVVFSAEGFCWPDRALASKYPTAPRGKRYLNSGGFIGYAPEIFKILNSSVVKNKDDDQLFYTNVFLDEKLRVKYGIKLDHKSEIFQNLNGAIDDVELRFNEEEEAYLHNKAMGTDPLVVHGNGPSKLVLNTLGSYLAKAYNTKDGCITCWDDIINLQEKDVKTFPVVLIALFIEHPTAFLEEFLNKIYELDYPKKKLHLFIHNAVEFHTGTVDSFLKKHEAEYRSFKRVNPEDDVKDPKARALALDYCKKKNCDYYFNVDSEAHVDNPHTLKLLVEQNRTVIAPVLVRPYKLWSNFWGAMTADGFYARSVDYMQIIHNERRGLWNVPYIRSCYLLNATLINQKELRPSYEHESLDSDMAFCNNIREKNIFMYVSNRFDYGHLVDNDNFDMTKTNPEVYQIFDNRWDWEQRYIHKNYTENLNPNTTIEQFKPETCSSDAQQTSASQMSLDTKAGAQPCPDVYWFPIVSERFCKEFIEIMEAFGKWSDGTNKDERLDGGYENVPTRDIHMKQVDLDPQWMEFLRLYVRPLQELVFTGYYHNPPRSLMNFVVRYRPDEQPSLRPHHDSSTYTINLALNRPNIDYEGGGCRFIRYNCSVTNTRIGWLLMHPGRLTHYHEGLQVTSGTRYIMISFVDP